MGTKYDTILGELRESDGSGGEGDVRHKTVQHDGFPTASDVAGWAKGSAGVVETESGIFWVYVARDGGPRSVELC